MKNDHHQKAANFIFQNDRKRTEGKHTEKRIKSHKKGKQTQLLVFLFGKQKESFNHFDSIEQRVLYTCIICNADG